ncbi:putative secreted protein (Por secretion system target) [Larkinella arboricola]|uniref:Putative secreted protein (Por secretion system target) n=1 Tax=Larkinella arboricola TaxID=643671 RepID=A0A327WUZ8_LARAB|nr:CotH kinase family protein [Larkinella arboricola]RAJ95506.1 putative secreted protein (Por secretion system target) [Larkinella arboricola]
MLQNFTLTRQWYVFFLTCFLLQVTATFAQQVPVSTGRYQIDNHLKLIVCNQLPAFPAGQSYPVLRLDKDYTFTEPVSAFEIGKAYKVRNSSAIFTLYFTGFPLIEIKTQGNQTISNADDRTKGVFSLANGSEPLFTSNMGIRIRGNISRRFPKKSYNMELWQDPNGEEEREVSLLNMREDSKWYLLAMYNEPLRLNNATSHAIWLDMHKVYYAAQEPKANSAIRTKYCDVFINGAYAGVYLFTEPMDRKQLQLKKTEDDGTIRGELYKAGGWTGATTFTGLPDPPTNPDAEEWASWEMDYPDPYWNNLYDLLKFLVNSPANEFKNTVSQKLRMDNVIDYYIFLNLTYATDNTGNNQFLARYKPNEPYFFIPWDFDGTFGYTTNFDRGEDTRSIIGNGLFNRLFALDPDGFKSKMRNRWFALRRNQLSVKNLKNQFAANYNLLTTEGAYGRENLKWSGTVNTGDFSIVNAWLENRLRFLDEYFALFPESNPQTELAYFRGEATGGGKSLNWSTRRETNLKRFELEFSPDGTTFSSVTTVTPTGDNQNGQVYNFVHNNTAALAFYRLKLVTNDDQFTYTSYLQMGANNCGSAPAVPQISASLTDITEGQTVILSASGCAQTVVWSNGQTGFSVPVNPEVTTVYTARCRQNAGCESAPSAPVQVNVYPEGSLPGSFEGYLGGLDCTLLRGWAWDRNRPNSPVHVEILDGQKVIATVIADDYRQDLKDAGKGNGAHGFNFSIPETLKDNLEHSFGTRIRGSSYILRDSPRKLKCAGPIVAPPVNQPPVAPTVSSLSATVNTAFSATLPAFTDPENQPLTYGLTGLPAGLTFSASTRTISGTPSAKANLSLLYTATDGANATSVPVSLVINDTSTPVNQPPVAPPVSALSATANTAFSVTLPAFTDPENQPLTYILSGLPAGLNFTASTRQITGTPSTAGNYTLTYAASDGLNSRSVGIALMVGSSNTPVTGDFEGFLDKVECGSIRGWVWDRRKPNEPLTVEFFANGVSIGTARADIFRPDILAAGKGNGYHVYYFPTPAQVKTGQTFQISAKVQGSTYTLKQAPKPLTCDPNARLSDLSGTAGNEDEVLITPNPSSGTFEVQFYTAAQTVSEVSVADEAGRLWYQKKREGIGYQQQRISLTGASGTYVVRVRQGKQIRTKKILIVK